MRTRLQTVIITSMALVIAVLAWALVYFGRDELHLVAKAPENDIPVHSALSVKGGFAAVRLGKESQEASGPEKPSERPHRLCSGHRIEPRKRPGTRGGGLVPII